MSVGTFTAGAQPITDPETGNVIMGYQTERDGEREREKSERESGERY